MNGEARISEPRQRSSRSAFPERTNPNRPAPAADGPWRETRGEARSGWGFSDPRRSQRPLTDEQRDLVTRYMPMARALARRNAFEGADADDLRSEAYAALVEAARTFDPDRGVNFAVHARPRIVGAIRDYRRFLFHANWKSRRCEPPVFQRLSDTDDLHGRVIGKEAEPPVGREFEVPEAVDAIIRRLPAPQETACRLLYFEDKSYDEVAAVLGCTRGYVSRLHGEALVRLRRDHREALAG